MSAARDSCDTCLVARRKVKITLDDETVRWVRVEAAKRDASVSRFVGDVLRSHMKWQRGYERAMRSYLSSAAQPAQCPGASYRFRGDLHDRASVR